MAWAPAASVSADDLGLGEDAVNELCPLTSADEQVLGARADHAAPALDTDAAQ